ncbi:MAG: carboxypeptidase-like regulatory domain-containing protein, partial [Planctomycetes bacterium]|nr:carboxypeptidase-like regulatory domain-containing protein [Planctomycetota bacterium]
AVVIALGTGFPLRGRVTGPDGKALPGEVALLRPRWREGARESVLRTFAMVTIDSEGRYAFRGVPAGEAVLLARPDGRRAVRTGVLLVPEVDTFDIRVPAAADLSGTVRDDAGRPVPGAEIGAADTEARVLSGKDGRFHLVGLPAGTLAGRVTAKATGEPLPFALVAAIPEFNAFGCQTRAGPDGEYRFPALEPGTYGVRAETRDFYQPGFPSVTVRSPCREDSVPPECLVRLGPAAAESRLDLALASGSVVEGTVRDAAGRPAPGVRIGLERDYGDLEDRPAHAITGPDGAFRLAGVPAGEWYIAAACPGGYAERVPVHVPPGAPVTGVVLTLGPRGTVRGVVVILDGGSPAGGRVRAESFSRAWVPKPPPTPVGDDGSFVLPDLHAGFVDLEATVPGYPDARVENVRVPEAGEIAGVRIEVQAGFTLHGRTVREDGSTVEGAVISHGHGSPAIARSDAGGHFVLGNFNPCERSGIEARLEGFVPARHRWSSPEDALRGEEVVLVLREARELTGRVLTADGDPLAGVSVWARSIPDPVLSSADGRFRVLGLPPDPFDLVIFGLPGEDGGWQPRVIPGVVPGGPALEARLERGLLITGRVSLAGEGPIDGAEITGTSRVAGLDGAANVLSSAARSGPDGRFVLSGLPPGPCELRAHVRGLPWQRRRWSATAGARDVEIVLGVGQPIRGRVFGLSGEPVAKTRIKATIESDESMSWEAETNAEGVFEFGNLDPGNYRITATPPSGAAPATVGGIAAGATEVEIRLSEGLAVLGRLLDGDGQPIPGVAVWSGGEFDPASRSGMSGEDGRFRITGLAPGAHSLELRPTEGGYRLRRPVEAVAGEGEVRLEAEEMLTIRGVILDRDGSPVRTSVYISERDPMDGIRSGDDGSFCFRGLEDHEYVLQVFGPEGQSVVVRTRGGEQDVEIRLP